MTLFLWHTYFVKVIAQWAIIMISITVPSSGITTSSNVFLSSSLTATQGQMNNMKYESILTHLISFCYNQSFGHNNGNLQIFYITLKPRRTFSMRILDIVDLQQQYLVVSLPIKMSPLLIYYPRLKSKLLLFDMRNPLHYLLKRQMR